MWFNGLRLAARLAESGPKSKAIMILKKYLGIQNLVNLQARARVMPGLESVPLPQFWTHVNFKSTLLPFFCQAITVQGFHYSAVRSGKDLIENSCC